MQRRESYFNPPPSFRERSGRAKRGEKDPQENFLKLSPRQHTEDKHIVTDVLNLPSGNKSHPASRRCRRVGKPVRSPLGAGGGNNSTFRKSHRQS